MNNAIYEKNDPKLIELFIFIYFCDLNMVLEIKNKHPAIYAKKDTFFIDEKDTFALPNLTLFNKIIWEADDWAKSNQKLVKKFRNRSNQMIEHWCNEYGASFLEKKFPYNQYWEHFFCEDPEYFETIFWDPISDYLEKGFRELDLRLYNRAECFDFQAVEELLKLGADSNIHFDGDGDSSTISRIDSEYIYLTSEVLPEFRLFEQNGYDQHFGINRMFRDLLGLAAHQEMHELLEKYR